MAYVKITSSMEAELKEVRAEVSRLRTGTEQDLATLLQVTEEEIDPITQGVSAIAARLEQLSAVLADLHVRVAQLEASP